MGKKEQRIERYDVLSWHAVAWLCDRFLSVSTQDVDKVIRREFVIPMSYIPRLSYMLMHGLCGDGKSDRRTLMALKELLQRGEIIETKNGQMECCVGLLNQMSLSFLKTSAYSVNPEMMKDRPFEFLCLECATALTNKVVKWETTIEVGIVTNEHDLVLETMAAAEDFADRVYGDLAVAGWLKGAKGD